MNASTSSSPLERPTPSLTALPRPPQRDGRSRPGRNTRQDRSQVDAGPEAVELEPPSEPITGDSHERHLAAVEELVCELGCTVAYEVVPGAAQGFYRSSTSEVVIEASQPPNSQLRTLLHEAAHALVDRESEVELAYSEEEVVVEIAGHIAAAAVGLDTSGEAIPYVAGLGDRGALDAARRCAELIDVTARRLEQALGVASVADAVEPVAG